MTGAHTWPVINVVTVSGEQQRDAATHIHVFILPSNPRPSRLPPNTVAPSCKLQGTAFCTLGAYPEAL